MRKSPSLFLVFCFAALLVGCDAFVGRTATQNEQEPQSPETTSRAWLHTTVGVASLDKALLLWRDTFGFEVQRGSAGDSRELERLFGLPDRAIQQHAIVSQPDSKVGKLLLIEFAAPLGPVRANAKLQDSLPKNIDLYVDELDLRLTALRDQGYSFRSAEPQSFVTDGILVREIHMPAHDETNIVLLERKDVDLAYNDKGYFGIGMIIITVPNIDIEEQFLTDLLGLNLAVDVRLAGPELEAATGLPPGTQWLIKILGAPNNLQGQIELIEYRGVDGDNLYARAKPGALGLTGVTYQVNGLKEIADYLNDIEISHRQVPNVVLANMCYDALLLRTPAGMPVQLLEQDTACSS